MRNLIFLFLFLHKVPPIDSSSTEGEVLDDSSFKGNVTFSNIEFSYPSRPDIKVPIKLMLRSRVYIAA